jgi:hypothetical protein
MISKNGKGRVILRALIGKTCFGPFLLEWLLRFGVIEAACKTIIDAPQTACSGASREWKISSRFAASAPATDSMISGSTAQRPRPRQRLLSAGRLNRRNLSRAGYLCHQSFWLLNRVALCAFFHKCSLSWRNYAHFNCNGNGGRWAFGSGNSDRGSMADLPPKRRPRSGRPC